MNRKKNTSAVLVYGVLVFITIICLFPIVWMCLISIKSASESITGFNSLMVSNPTMANFKRLFEMIPVGQNAFNSVFTTIMGTITSLFFCALAGFAFAKYRFPGRKFLFYFVIATMLVPPEVGSVPLFIIMKKVGLINSLWSLVIPRIATAVGIFYMNQYITDVPDELVEAARIDGCGVFRSFFKIMIPTIKTGIITVVVISFLNGWNDLIYSMTFNVDADMRPLTANIRKFQSKYGTKWNCIMAYGAILVIPVILAFVFLQKYIVGGLTAGAVKE